MKVIYVLPQANRCGGVKVIATHVTGLCDRGHDAEVWGLFGDFGWFGRPVPHRKFPHTDALGAALRETRAAKVATFWVTASWVAHNLLPGETGFYLIQDEDELTYGGSTAGTSYKLGLVPVTEGAWVSAEIERKYDTPCNNVGIGIDPVTYRPLPCARNQFEVLTPCRTTSAGPGGLKGWDLALAALKELAAREPRATLVTYGVEACPPVGFMPHAHHRTPTDRKLRELYSFASVFLSCSRHEGFGLPMLEAMACSCPVVCTDARGNREFCRHRDTALVTDGTPETTAELLREILAAPETTAPLAAAASETAARYRWPPVIDALVRLYTQEHRPCPPSAS